jgi:hypothetical protein
MIAHDPAMQRLALRSLSAVPAADAAREVKAAAAAKVEDEKQKLAAIRSILNVLPASPSSEVFAALSAATPANLGVMVSLTPGGHEWCTANAGTHDFLEHAAAILAERLGLPARSRGATGSSTGRGGDGGSSGEHDTTTKGAVDLNICVEGRLAGTKTIGATPSVVVSANMTAFKPGPVAVSQLIRNALLMFATDKQPVQSLNGVRYAMNEGLREYVATDHDTGLAAYLASDPIALDELLYCNPRAVANAIGCVTFLRKPAPGSLQVAYAPDARARSEGAHRVVEALAAVTALISHLRRRFGLSHREQEFNANAAAAQAMITGLARTLSKLTAEADTESIDAGTLPVPSDAAAEQNEVADLLEVLLKQGFQLAGDDCKSAFDGAGGGKPGLDAVSAGGRGTYPALATDPVTNAAAVETFVERFKRRLFLRSARAAAQTDRFASAPAGGGGRFGGGKPGAVGGGDPSPSGSPSALPKNVKASLIKLGTIKDASLRACLGAPPPPSRAASAFISQADLAAVLPKTAPPNASLCWTQFQLPAHAVCKMNGAECTRETTWKGAARPLYHILPASMDALKSSVQWND